MNCLSYPFDSAYILRKRKSIKKQLLQSTDNRITKRIAVLGGSTTHDICEVMELFLLKEGIEPVFLESEYGQYWQEAMFDSKALHEFNPDVIFVHTTGRNIQYYPNLQDSPAMVDERLNKQFEHFKVMWEHLSSTYHCPIIQNNFERPLYRLLGNRDVYDCHGKTNFIVRLNQLMYEYAQTHNAFYINDIDYLSASYGLNEWLNSFYWDMYKYALCVPAIPEFAFNISNIIKSIFGKNKKAYVLDMDNTLWGGVIGESGPEGIQLGPETSLGEAYMAFQSYIKAHEDLGALLNICSKNDMENALGGLSHPNSILKEQDFSVIKANWEDKAKNVREIAKELNIGEDSLVFIDDNPAERLIVNRMNSMIETPDIGSIEQYIQRLDRCGYFEVTTLSKDDLHRAEMYKANAQRTALCKEYADYPAYLKDLNMTATIGNFTPIAIQRIAQLTNKTNQFNLTTRRFTEEQIRQMSLDSNYICLYGQLEDRFGDNGIVSVIIGEKRDRELHIILWIMSCRVLKRNMEFAMFDSLIERCQSEKVAYIIGYYYPTVKNKMVCDFYKSLGFTKILEDDENNTTWKYDIKTHKPKNDIIKVINPLTQEE